MLPYNEIHSHHIGRSHVQNGLSCEDYSLAYSDGHLCAAVISDGHGDKNCVRSAAGARIACETCIDLFRAFRERTGQISDIEIYDFEAIVKTLEFDLAGMWKKRVLYDAQIHPFSEEELSVPSEEAANAYREGRRIERAYGCTLAAAMIAENYWLAVQIGDGICAAAYEDGVFAAPVPADEECVGNRSTSICSSNAAESFRHYFSKIKPLAVFVCSDGVEESFDSAGLMNCFYSVAVWTRNDGAENAREKLEELLPRVSTDGSGDDVSLGAIISLEGQLSPPHSTLDTIYEKVNSCENAKEHIESMLSAANERLLENREKCNTLDIEIDDLKELIEAKTKELEEAEAESKRLEEKIAELTPKHERIKEQMKKALAYKSGAEEYWFRELDRLGISRDGMKKAAPPKKVVLPDADIADFTDYDNVLPEE